VALNKTVFAVGAHPDDIEFLMAGTLLLLNQRGFEIHLMHLASGSCGTSQHDIETIIRIRSGEAKEAAEILGAVYHPPLVEDLQIFYEPSLLFRVAAIVREIAPQILLVHSPDDYMEDHMNACRLAVTAAFARGMRNFPVEPAVKPIDWEVTIYHAQPHMNMNQLGKRVIPDLFVDISDVMHRKKQALLAHRSQMEWLDDSQAMDSPIRIMTECARDVGEMSGRFEWAEGWRKHHPAGLCKKDADPLKESLREWILERPD